MLEEDKSYCQVDLHLPTHRIVVTNSFLTNLGKLYIGYSNPIVPLYYQMILFDITIITTILMVYNIFVYIFSLWQYTNTICLIKTNMKKYM